MTERKGKPGKVRLSSGEKEQVPVSGVWKRYQIGELGLEEETSGKWGIVMEMCGGAEAGGQGPIISTDAPPQGLEEDCTAASEFPSNLIAVDELGFRVPLTEGNGEIKWNNVM